MLRMRVWFGSSSCVSAIVLVELQRLSKRPVSACQLDCVASHYFHIKCIALLSKHLVSAAACDKLCWAAGALWVETCLSILSSCSQLAMVELLREWRAQGGATEHRARFEWWALS